MTMPRHGAGPRSAQPLSIAVMAAIALLQPLAEYFATRDRARLLAKIVALAVGLPPVILLGTSSFRWAVRRRGRPLLLVTLGATASGLLFAAVLSAVRALSFAVEAIRPHVGVWGPSDVVRIGFIMGLTNFALWALAMVLPVAAEDVRVRALELDKLRAEAELAQIRAQFTPHFLLNTLNAVAGLVTEDPREARRLLASLGDLVRESLRKEDEMQPLASQLEWLRAYARILQVRHAGQLSFRWEVDERTRRAVLPRWILQPLIENAVTHGALKRRGGGEVTVSASLDGGKLVCVIQDNGPGLDDGAPRDGSLGLALVRRRLALKYADAASVRLESTPAGARSIVEVPYGE